MPPQDRSSRAAPCRRRSPESRTRSTPRRPRSTPAPRSTTTSSASSSTSTPTARSCGVLATDWNADDDTTWTFDLVDNATFHNGETFTADDVKYTFERILDPKTASAYAAALRHDQERRGRVADPSGLPPQDAVRTVPVEPREQRRDREPEGDRGGGSRPATPSAPDRSSSWSGCRAITSRSRSSTGTSRRASRTSTAIDFKFLLVDQSRIDGLSAGELNWVDAVPLQSSRRSRPTRRYTYVTSATAGIPDLPGAEHRAGAVRQQARPAGGALGARPDADPRRRVLRAPARWGSRRCRRAPPGTTGPRPVTPRPGQGEGAVAAGRPRERPDGRVPGPAAIPRAAEDRAGRARTAEAGRHHDEHQAGRRVDLVRRVRQGQLPDHVRISGAHDRPRQLLRARDQERRRRSTPRPTRTRRSTISSIRRGSKPTTPPGSSCTSRSGRSCTTTRRSSTRTTKRSTT